MSIFDRFFGGHHRGGGGHHGGADHHGGGYGQGSLGVGGPAMACPKCRSINVASARFCQQCGNSLTLGACVQCGATFQPGAKFCEQCGKPAA